MGLRVKRLSNAVKLVRGRATLGILGLKLCLPGRLQQERGCEPGEPRALLPAPPPTGAQGRGWWGGRVLGTWRSPGGPRLPAAENSQPPTLPASHPLTPAHSPSSEGRPGVEWPPRGSPSWRDRAMALPSRRGLLPGLHSEPQLGSRSLFLFAQKNPWPRGSSQRHCAGNERP